MLKRWLRSATEPLILFPVLAVLILTVIWGTTLHLIKVEYAVAENTAMLSSNELGLTYEAQVVRALREIDQTLKVVKFTYELGHEQAGLEVLKARGLLPPDLLFVVSVTDRNGTIVASTREPSIPSVADQDYFQLLRQDDVLAVGRTQLRPNPDLDSGPDSGPDLGTEEWILPFSRRLNAADGTFAGIVIVAVDASYFVSGYESSKLGEHGVLGLLGTDGLFRVRRSGDTVSYGEQVDYAAVLPVTTDTADSGVRLSNNPWDGVQRYISAHELYNFPLAIIVGLSAEEQLIGARQNMRTYLWRASIGSLLLSLIVAVLGYMSWQLALSRQRAAVEQVAHAKRVEHLAYHDGLTALPNRSLFSKLLEQSINQAQRYNRQLAVLFLDLDGFKLVNDSLGHEAGDQLLQEVAARLKTCLRDSDTVARLGGDEFVVLLAEQSGENNVAAVAQKILFALARPFILTGQEWRITGSIGISTYPQDGLDEQTLKKCADLAMYQAKEQGKNNFQFYSTAMDRNSLARSTLESGLRYALERGEFQLYYQAKRDVRTERITGTEALLRWQHPELGTVAPLQFIPIAEETGLIIPIGKWVLRTACQQNVAWQQQGFPPLHVAVNLTARQFFDEYLLPDLIDILASTGMDGRLLELEIHESFLLRDVQKTLRIMTALNAQGIRVAVDDFGIGYGTLATLKQFPLNTIKIDRSFIRDLASVAEDRDLIDAVVAIGRKLSLTVVAQGVETKDQAEYLRQHSCDEIQGFYLNKPLPADQIAELLRS
ncbi:MAG: EAL domain-containing protein [Gammaproteobacteria bacterium]